jgi:23S rRNA G2445 N2-methylase RlmL
MIIDNLRIVGAPLTNKVMMGELSRLAVRAISRRPPEPRKAGTGTLVYPFDPGLAVVAATYLRTSTRALWDLYTSSARRLEPLYADLLADVVADTRGWIRDGDAISIEAGNVGPFAAGARQIVGVVKNAILDGCQQRKIRVRVDPDQPDLRLFARLDDDESVVVSIDLVAGRDRHSMSQRGWRLETGAAPLREHLAAVLLMLARFDARQDVLLDPMCGSGTIPIEAALMARGEPLLMRGRPNCVTRPPLDVHGRELGQPLFADADPVVIGNDRDLDVLVAAKGNAGRAGVTGKVVWRRGDLAGLQLAEIEAIAAERGRTAKTGLILANPPYGERLDDADLRLLYGEISDMCQRFPGWRAAFLLANPSEPGDGGPPQRGRRPEPSHVAEDEFERVFRGRRLQKKPLSNGNLRGYFYLYEL